MIHTRDLGPWSRANHSQACVYVWENMATLRGMVIAVSQGDRASRSDPFAQEKRLPRD